MNYKEKIESLKSPKEFKVKLLEDLKYLEFNNYLDKILVITLFGSLAKGTYTSRSDIDLCIITEEELSLREKADIRMELKESGKIETNAVFFTKNFYLTNMCTVRLIKEIDCTGVVLYKKEGD